MLAGMAGLNGLETFPYGYAPSLGWFELQWLALLLILSWSSPNSQELVRGLDEEAVKGAFVARPTLPWATAAAVLLLLSLPHIFVKRPFLYFQF